MVAATTAAALLLQRLLHGNRLHRLLQATLHLQQLQLHKVCLLLQASLLGQKLQLQLACLFSLLVLPLSLLLLLLLLLQLALNLKLLICWDLKPSVGAWV